MTTLFKIASAAAALGATALLIPTTAFAQDDETIVRGERAVADLPTGYVKFRDINLASDDGVTALRNRIRRVANAICVTQGVKDLKQQMSEFDCRNVAIESAEPQIASVIERFRAGEFAALTPIAIVGTK